MLKTLVAFTTVLAVTSLSQAFVLPAGKCKNVTGLPIDFIGLSKIAHWVLLYYPDGEAFNNVDSDHEDLFYASNIADRGLHRIQLKDGSVSPYVYKYTYGTDNVLYEEVIHDKGRKQVFKIYTLFCIPDVNAFLYYRCSDTGSLDYDTRFIGIPEGNILDAAGEQVLLTKDMSYNFTGGIHKLSSKLPW